MIKSYIDFSRRNWPLLLFGAMLMALSSFGQTFFVAMSGAYFREAFSLSDGGLGTAYAVGTFASAMTLTWAGRLIDYTTVRRFTWSVAFLLAFACILVAVSPNYFALAVAFYFLRLGGQGLMTHTALTATARAFPQDAGKALGLIALGLSLSQGILPFATISIMDTWGWRTGWLLNSLAVLLGVTVALRFLPVAGDKPLRSRKTEDETETAPSLPLWRDARLLLTLPAVLATPFVVTGFFFHQARLAEQKGWDIATVAGSLGAFAIVQAAALVLIGPVIDRLGPKRLLPLFLLPQAAAMLLLAIASHPLIAPIHMLLMAISAAFGSTLATALWVDLFGTKELARVRSAVEAGAVLASGASPIVMGLLIDAGVSLSLQALGCFVYSIGASLVALGVRTPEPEIGR
ncbi:MFS transporter [Pseudorhizobium flavum]|uniref:Putative MFS family arabinose efflux permease n=1 Tax=Pseudorhizobium flavum TaxID=1335061 RepID=A0A7W9YUW0_9HYPH|nr:MFS transporter [Pseudorhizobium flavum]MBB6178066.1 putative MFS family arabinose efflux permease [Pseudorhizobium flavum]CAD6615090.1 MFS transporter [Pseudorhizobium flavum]